MKILLVGGDAESQAESMNALQLAFGDEVELESATSHSALRRELQSSQYHIVLDLGPSEEAHWRLLRLVRQLDPLVQLIMVFESNQEDLLTDALRQGASEGLVRNGAYPALLPLIAERTYERYVLLEQRRRASRQTFDLEALDEFTRAVAQAMDLSKAMEQARTALHEIDILLEKSREELVKRRVMLREAGSEVQRRERGLKALSDLAEAVSRSPDLDFILANTLDQALAMTAAEAGAVLIVEGESKPLRLVAQKRLSDELIAALSGQWLEVSAFMTFLISGKVLLVQDVAHSDAPPELLSLLSQEGFTSMIGVPLQAGGNLLGGLMVATRHAERLTKRDARWLGVMGQQAGIAIENARLRTEIWEAAETWFRQPIVPSPIAETAEASQTEMEHLAQALDETKRQLRRRENALSAIVNVIGTASHRPDVLDILQEILPNILEESEAGGIWIQDEPSETLTLVAQTGLPEELAHPRPRQEWEQDSLLAALMSGEPVYLDAPSSQAGDGTLEQLKAAGAQVIVGVPLQIQGQSVGAMVITARQSGQLQSHDAELLTAIGQQLGQALERQKLHNNIHRLTLELMALQEQRDEASPPLEMFTALQEMASQAQRREKQFTALHQLSQLLAQDDQQVLKAGLQSALNALGANGGLILQRDPVQNHLSMVHQVGLPGTFVDKWAPRPIRIQESLPPDLLEDPQTIILTADTLDQPALIADLLLLEDCVQAIVLTPLSLRWKAGSLLGVLMLVFTPPASDHGKVPGQATKPPIPPTKNDIQWLDLVAQTMALSIAPVGQIEVVGEAAESQPSGLAEETDQHSRETRILLELARLLFPILDANKLLEKATQEIAHVTDMDACWVMILEKIREGEGKELVMRAPHGLSQEFTRHLGRSTTDKGLHGQVMASSQPTFLADLSQVNERLSIAWELESLRAFAGIPLKVSEQCLGLLAVARTSPHPFSPSEQRLLTAITQQLSIALHNAQYFAQIQQTSNQQEKGNRVLREINNLLMGRLAEMEKRIEALKAAKPTP